MKSQRRVRGVCAVGVASCLMLGAQVPTAVIDDYDLEHASGREPLPHRLDEASGLAVTSQGRVFSHGDERAVVYQVDPETGSVVKQFSLGVPVLPGDFEGIAVWRERFFLISSQGLLLEFREGDEGASVQFRGVDTGLLARCEAEGLAVEAATESLVVACKEVPRAQRGSITLYRIRLSDLSLDPNPMRVALTELTSVGLPPRFAPSGVEVDPATGHLILVSARDEALVEISPAGRVVAGVRLGSSRHPQAEGITLTSDGTLLLADERRDRRARLTRYAPKPSSPDGRP